MQRCEKKKTKQQQQQQQRNRKKQNDRNFIERCAPSWPKRLIKTYNKEIWQAS